MKVICASKIDSNKYYVVFEPPYAGASFMEGIIKMMEEDFALFNVPMFESRGEAWKHAYDRMYLYDYISL